MKAVTSFSALAVASADFNPLQKVQTLLQNMKAEQEAEQQKDEEMYKKMDCWCNSNRDSKNAAVEEAKTVIETRTADAKKHDGAAEAAKLAMENAKAARAKAEEDLKDAQAKNEKDAQAFADATEELDFNIKSVDQAVKVLSEATGQKANLPTEAKEALLQVTNKNMESPYGRKLQADLLEMFAAFPDQNNQLRSGKLGLVGGPGYQSYNAQSGQIFGMLQQMSVDMNRELDTFKQEEAARIDTFNQVVANLNEQIETATKTATHQQQVMAENQMAAANARQEVTETKASLGENEQFLLDLEDRCAENDEIFKANLEMRGEELKALGEALSILNSDSVRELFDNKRNAAAAAAFVQTRTGVTNPARAKAISLLKKQGGLQLLALAATIKNSAFDKIKEAIDAMVADISQQLKDDAAHRDVCIEDIHQNEVDASEADTKMKSLQKLIDTRKAEVAAGLEKIAAAEEQIQSTYESIQEAGEDRAEESKNFQEVQKNGNKIDFVLKGVLAKLKAVYAKESLVQMKEVSAHKQEPDAPPAMVKAAEHNSGAGGVLTLISEIIGDNKAELAAGIKDNQFAQDSYNKMTASSFAEVQDLNELITSQRQANAVADSVIVDSKNERGNTYDKLEGLNNAKINLHNECDFLLENFDVRQEAMRNEIDAINGAKAILSGAVFE